MEKIKVRKGGCDLELWKEVNKIQVKITHVFGVTFATRFPCGHWSYSEHDNWEDVGMHPKRLDEIVLEVYNQ